MPKSRGRKKSKSKGDRTSLGDHAKVGGVLHPPFSRLDAALGGGRLALTSWMNDRLPEMIWAALIRASVDQSTAIGEFRRIVSFIEKSGDREILGNVTLTGISALNVNLREQFIQHILSSKISSESLVCLRLFPALPALESWLKYLPNAAPDTSLLMKAVGQTLWHQSQEATDCRWLRVFSQYIAGRLNVPPQMADEWKGYPLVGDQRSVRPGIRATEGTLDAMQEPDISWPNAFWAEAWRKTPCLSLSNAMTNPPADLSITQADVTAVIADLREHWGITHLTTAIDPKHDAIFGMAFYVLFVLEEILNSGAGSGVLGRIALRTILETRITLRYMASSTDSKVWEKWRVYGAGQAKLSALKFDEMVDAPSYIDTESVEQIAGEDMWEEFLPINLGNWASLDLRKISEKAGLKDKYDQHYSWISGYVHGSWGGVREACFQTCGNPLHRLHRYPQKKSLRNVVADAVDLVDQVLDEVSFAYPGFESRIGHSKN